MFLESKRPPLLTRFHYVIFAGHPGQNKMYYGLQRIFYWPHMAVDAMVTVRSWRSCACSRARPRTHLNRLQLFSALCSLQSVAVDVLGPLRHTKHGKRFISVISDRFTKLTQATALLTIWARTAVLLCAKPGCFKTASRKLLFPTTARSLGHVCSNTSVNLWD